METEEWRQAIRDYDGILENCNFTDILEMIKACIPASPYLYVWISLT